MGAKRLHASTIMDYSLTCISDWNLSPSQRQISSSNYGEILLMNLHDLSQLISKAAYIPFIIELPSIYHVYPGCDLVLAYACSQYSATRVLYTVSSRL